MAHNEVLLVKPVDGLGAEGDRVKVRAGFARNYLLPQGIALPVNNANRKYIDALQAARTKREAKEITEAQAAVEKIKTLSLAFAVKTGEGGKMFGAITVKDIHAKLLENGVDICQKRIHLGQGPVKVLGKSIAHLKLHPEIAHELEFEVVSLNPIVAVTEKVEEEEARFDKKGRRITKPRKTKDAE